MISTFEMIAQTTVLPRIYLTARQSLYLHVFRMPRFPSQTFSSPFSHAHFIKNKDSSFKHFFIIVLDKSTLVLITCDNLKLFRTMSLIGELLLTYPRCVIVVSEGLKMFVFWYFDFFLKFMFSTLPQGLD